MRLPADGLKARPAKFATALTLALALGAWGTVASAARRDSPPAAPANGPLADYPVIVGQPYIVAGTEYVPEDVRYNYPVGLVAADEAGGNAISAAHHTLPLPSYVEVTSLDTGRTALVRVERRGPMTGQELVALSPGALAQLGIAAEAPVRVRRINPPEDHRALLRAGQPAPLRMDTPMPLVEVLRRKLPGAGAVPVQASALPARSPFDLGAAFEPPASPTPAPAPAAAANTAVEGGFVVQAASFSTAGRAEPVADALGGTVSPSGRYFRVRTGPFATRAEAEASLAKVRAAGYRDARIHTSG